MTPERKCCGPCNEIGICDLKANCCLECHLAFEEEQAVLYLPAGEYQDLIWQHEALEANGFQPDAVRKHSTWEDELFASFFPPEALAQVELDHKRWERGSLRQRR